MKLKLLQIAITLGAGCSLAQAAEYGNVIFSVAVAPTVLYAPAPVYGYYTDAVPSIAVVPRVMFGGYWRHAY